MAGVKSPRVKGHEQICDRMRAGQALIVDGGAFGRFEVTVMEMSSSEGKIVFLVTRLRDDLKGRT